MIETTQSIQILMRLPSISYIKQLGNDLRAKGLLFLLVGAVNFLGTSILLLFLVQTTSSFAASLAAQAFNFTVGYFAYGRYIFIRQHKGKGSLMRYFLLSVSAWLLNWGGLSLLQIQLHASKTMAGLIMICFLSAYSFIFQSTYVYK
jgi:putative flippase GtrA